MLKITTNFDFGQLATNLPQLLKSTVDDSIDASVIASKDVIKSGRLQSLEKSTLEIREHRGISGSTPLYATGDLYKSIRRVKAGMEFRRYGMYHRKGFKPTRVPYIDKYNKIVYPPNYSGVRVPPRDFITFAMADVDKFYSELNKSLKV